MVLCGTRGRVRFLPVEMSAGTGGRLTRALRGRAPRLAHEQTALEQCVFQQRRIGQRNLLPSEPCLQNHPLQTPQETAGEHSGRGIDGFISAPLS